MDLDNLITIIIWVLVAKWCVGAGYGFYLLRKNIPITDWKDVYIVGPLFWLAYGIAKFLRWCTTRFRG